MENQIINLRPEPKLILFERKNLEERFHDTYKGGENHVIFGMSILKADRSLHFYEGEIDCGFYRSHRFLGLKVVESRLAHRFNKKWVAKIASEGQGSCFCFDREYDKPRKIYEFFIGSKENVNAEKDPLFIGTDYVLTGCYIMRGLLEYNPNIPPMRIERPTRTIII